MQTVLTPLGLPQASQKLLYPHSLVQADESQHVDTHSKLQPLPTILPLPQN